jgi:hypothetical protein
MELLFPNDPIFLMAYYCPRSVSMEQCDSWPWRQVAGPNKQELKIVLLCGEILPLHEDANQ